MLIPVLLREHGEGPAFIVVLNKGVEDGSQHAWLE